MYYSLSQAPASAQQVLDQLPPCWSQEFQDCHDEYVASYEAKREPSLSSYCEKYYSTWRNTPAAMFDAAVDVMPYCSKNQIQSAMGYGVIGAALVAGLVIGFVLKKA